MSTRTMLRILAVAGAVLTTVGLAAPAWADDGVAAKVSGLSSALTAGGRTDNFSGSVTNNTEQPIFNAQRMFLIHLDGLSTDGIRLSRSFGGHAFGALALSSPEPGTVAAVDPQGLFLNQKDRRGSNVTASYQIGFTAIAPAGHATVRLEVYVGQVLIARSNDRELTVKSSNVAITASATPSTVATPTTPADTATANPVLAGPSPYGPSDVGGLGIGWPLYVIGGLFVAGGAVLLYLLLRKPRGTPVEYPAGVDRFDGFAAVRPPDATQPLGSGRHSAPTYRPTTVMPAVPPTGMPMTPTMENPTLPNPPPDHYPPHHYPPGRI
jgi:hypothetical protein